jgi:cytochrome c-type biogenesis protein CcmF
MEYLSHLYLPGALALWCAVIFSLSTMWGYVSALSGNAASLTFARRSYGFFALSIVLAAVLLSLLLMLRDFRVEYVYQYSGLDLPTHYQFAAFWAGQKGSFMIWLFWGTLLGLLLRRSAGANEPAIMGIYTLTLTGLLFILVRENPFIMLGKAPWDGQGLNPLLQDNWMVIHPPIMFIGYAASAIPFAFAIASLWRRRYDGWAERAFPWALGGFLVLGTAILLGGYWAYKTLGWGGFWGWDPVENASFIPWLFGTVLIHGLHMERTQGRYRRANYVFTVLTYISVLYGTFLTRSGVLADFSVHSFVDLGISGWLTFLLGGFSLLGVGLLVLRWREIPTAPNEDPFLSRGTFMVLGTITILIAALVITVGTSAPLLTRFMKDPSQVGPSFYNRVTLPIAMLVALLLALVPYLPWRGIAFREVARKMLWPFVVGVAVTAGAVLWKIHDAFHLVFILLATLALATNFQKTVDKLRGASGLRGAGGYLAHVGVGFILLGIITSSGYDVSTKVTLIQGVPQKVDDMTLTFKRFIPRQGREKERMEVEVARAGRKPFNVYPKFFINDRTRQVMVNPDIKSSALQDLYVSPIDFDPGQPRLRLAKGETGQVGGMQVKFVRFDLQAQGGNAIAAMSAGQPVTIGAAVEVTQGGQTTALMPLYRINPATSSVDTPPMPLPGGGAIMISGINATNGAVQFDVSGVPNPAKLSIDVTRKPLIQLVWGGFYIVLLGGILAAVHRFRQMRVLERVAEAKAKAA